MKKSSILLAFLVLAIISCKKDLIRDNAIKENVTKEKVPNSKKVGSRPLLPNDPNLDKNWDWTEQSWTVYFNNANGTVGKIPTLNPFFDGGQKIYGNTNRQQADIFPKSGWMLVSRDFGTPTEGNAYPFFVLYNKYRGVLRVGVLRTVDVQSSYQQISLSFSNSTSTPLPKLFKFAGKNADYVNGNANITFQQSAITFAGVQQWMIADFNVQGYSSVISDFAAINISVSEITQSDIQLTGNLKLDGTAQPQTAGTSTIGLIKNVSNFYFSTESSIKPILDETVVTGAGAAIFLKSVLNLVSGFSAGNVGSAYNIKLNGSINQNGTIKTTSPKTSFSIYLKAVSNTNAYRSLQVIPWGVFDINKIPVSDVYYGEVPDYNAGYGDDGRPNRILGHSFNGTLPQGCISNGASLLINPALINDISTIEVNTIYSRDSHDPKTFVVTEFKPYKVFESTPQFVGTGIYRYLALGLKITFKDGSIVFNTIPINSGAVHN
jgi:hypothetical protein